MSRFPLPAPTPPLSPRWSSSAFEEEVVAWLAPHVGRVELEPVKVRPWAAVWRASTGGATWFVKENCPASAFEGALVERLGDLVPDHVVPVKAVDRATGRFLTPDQGEPLGFGVEDLEVWRTIVRQYAELQRTLVDHEADLRGVGVVTLAPAHSEELVRDRAAALRALPVDDPAHLDDEGMRRLDECLPSLRRAVESVRALGLPLTLNHNDLHGHNVFVGTGGALTFFDWGDAMLTDPTAVVLVPMRNLADGLSCAPDDPRLRSVADAWVEVWSDLVPAAELRAALPDALRIARLARHESWARVTTGLTEQERADWGEAARYWLLEVAAPA
jgi:phosphotransferase family enzyme